MNIPPHIQGNEMLKCLCGASTYHKHPKIEKWLFTHGECKNIIASEERKFCKDCIHFSPEMSSWNPTDTYYKCLRETHLVDSVRGQPQQVCCDTERDTGECGPAAKFFSPK